MAWAMVLPLTLPGVLAGCILVFIPTIGAFVTPDLLGGTQGLMIGNLIQRQFRGTSGNFPLGSAISAVMMGLVLFSLYVQSGGLAKLIDRVKAFSKRMRPVPVAAAATPQGAARVYRKITTTRTITLDQNQIQRDMLVRRIGKIGLWANPVFNYVHRDRHHPRHDGRAQSGARQLSRQRVDR